MYFSMRVTASQTQLALGRVFAFCYVWAVGGNLSHTVQEEFDEFCREQLANVASFPGGSHAALGEGRSMESSNFRVRGLQVKQHGCKATACYLGLPVSSFIYACR